MNLKVEEIFIIFSAYFFQCWLLSKHWRLSLRKKRQQ